MGWRSTYENLLPEYLGAEDSDYTYQVMRLWMLGAVSRVYKTWK
ncbi:MAG: VapE domain-containing protein [Blautia massiliensis (ex Durand et al. 2017)]